MMLSSNASGHRARSQRPSRPRALGAALMAAAVSLALPSTVAAFATIPEGQVVSRDGQRDLIHIRVQSGCETDPTDRVEVEIPESVVGVIPAAVPGWSVDVEMVETEPYDLFGVSETERVSRVTWTGGPLEADEFLDFGITAVFTEPADELRFPVVQGCGEVEQVWDQVAEEGQNRAELEFPVPVVRVVEPPSIDLDTLRAELGELRQELEDLRLGDIGGTRLRDRLSEVERRLDRAEERLEEDGQS